MTSGSSKIKTAIRRAGKGTRQADTTGSTVDISVASPAPEASGGTPTALAATGPTTSRPKADSKLGIVLGLLEDPAGASLGRLVSVNGWLPHTTRAALTGLRKRGFVVVLDCESKDAGPVYRIRTEAA